ncbi:MAG: ATP-dependent DNA helicase RecG [Candidatus Hydrogenedens sp.]|nr:ATP-dependent DNA helicase RecG [Candidatus Hydrogenedens sp.]
MEYESPTTGTALELDAPVAVLPGIGAKRAALLAGLGIVSLRDLVWHLPRRYEDRRSFAPLGGLAEDDEATVMGTVTAAREVRLRGRQTLAVVEISDGTGSIKATFFGRGFLVRSVFKKGARLILSGRVGQYKGLSLDNPDYEALDEDAEREPLHTGRLVPVYPLTEGLSQRDLRRWVWQALGAVDLSGADIAPEPLRRKHALSPAAEALRQAHFPDTPEASKAARKALAYDEVLALQARLLMERAEASQPGRGLQHRVNGPLLKALHGRLPFPLTDAQDRVVSLILGDMASDRPMRRLVQGDVGCGKTVVALHAVAVCLDTGAQAAVMAPTEILAEQHYLNFRDWLEPLGVRMELLTGSAKGAAAARNRLASGESQLAVGTHSLIQDSTGFARLGLAIIDEQHRFGVAQRERLAGKAEHEPDVLQLSATPIPRTLALTLYGHMDVSVIDQLPPGRQPVETRHVQARGLDKMYREVHVQIAEGRQVYVVCPLVEGSTEREAKAVLEHFEDLEAGPFAGLRLGLLHGRMKPDEKDAVMRAFKAGATQVLVSTTVIEVGVDVPNASVMIIEDAHQFSLTQLHQLRGRIGRGAHESVCYLTGKPTTKPGRQRIERICALSSGFDVAEADLAMRGPGEVFGFKQAGLSEFRVADLLADTRLLETAREDAEALLAEDAQLAKPEHAALKRRVQAFQGEAGR